MNGGTRLRYDHIYFVVSIILHLDATCNFFFVYIIFIYIFLFIYLFICLV